MTRDRDPAGRPRNARPRDGLGRPLDRADGPGSGADRIPDDLVITGAEAAVLADRLLRDGRPFHAHEVLEAAWKSGPAEELSPAEPSGVLCHARPSFLSSGMLRR